MKVENAAKGTLALPLRQPCELGSGEFSVGVQDYQILKAGRPPITPAESQKMTRTSWRRPC